MFEVPATSSIFFEKLGKHPETRAMFKLLEFVSDPLDDPSFIKVYKCEKTKEKLNKIKKINDLLKKIASMDV